ncbi:hypothetical protein EYF80_025266 [Liparis tanakae]|uniref:Uncharacterized protein n=1 Tax=Liparis tanakae TaxID=230148 RepID=A0A4Z2HF69_9TELE|nr:hypothetical protein EYF80_025266 [Liparis tanakae]
MAPPVKQEELNARQGRAGMFMLRLKVVFNHTRRCLTACSTAGPLFTSPGFQLALCVQSEQLGEDRTVYSPSCSDAEERTKRRHDVIQKPPFDWFNLKRSLRSCHDVSDVGGLERNGGGETDGAVTDDRRQDILLAPRAMWGLAADDLNTCGQKGQAIKLGSSEASTSRIDSLGGICYAIAAVWGPKAVRRGRVPRARVARQQVAEKKIKQVVSLWAPVSLFGVQSSAM